jgi:hypothetical protein
MARNREETEEEFSKRVFKVFKSYEKHIDEMLVENMPEIRAVGHISFNSNQINLTPDNYKDALVELIKDRYKDWGVKLVNDSLFFYYEREKSMLSLFDNVEERFANLDIRSDDVGEIGDMIEGIFGDNNNDNDDDIPF